VDVERTGNDPDRDKIIEVGIRLFEYERQSGRIYAVLGSREWLEGPGLLIPSEVTNIKDITDAMFAEQRIDNSAVIDLPRPVVLVIAQNANFDGRFPEKRLPSFSTKHLACSRADIEARRQAENIAGDEFERNDRIPSPFQSISARAASSARSAIAANEPLPFAADLQD